MFETFVNAPSDTAVVLFVFFVFCRIIFVLGNALVEKGYWNSAGTNCTTLALNDDFPRYNLTERVLVYIVDTDLLNVTKCVILQSRRSS